MFKWLYLKITLTIKLRLGKYTRRETCEQVPGVVWFPSVHFDSSAATVAAAGLSSSVLIFSHDCSASTAQ